jgi:hypothetical protein
MRLHRNAKLSVKGRELLVDRVENGGWSLVAVAEAAGVSQRTASKSRDRNGERLSEYGCRLGGLRHCRNGFEFRWL